MLIHIEMNRALDVHEAVADPDFVVGLDEPVHMAFEAQVEKDIVRLAVQHALHERRIVEFGGHAAAEFRRRDGLRKIDEALALNRAFDERLRCAARTGERPGTWRQLTRLETFDDVERQQGAGLAGRVRHDDLLSRPVAVEIRHAARQPRGARLVPAAVRPD